MLSKKHTEDVCLVYKGAHQCRYLEGDVNDSTKHYCQKKTLDKAIIDEVIDDFIKDCKKKGADPMDFLHPLGDNCSGLICLKSKLQGYDVED